MHLCGKCLATRDYLRTAWFNTSSSHLQYFVHYHVKHVTCILRLASGNILKIYSAKFQISRFHQRFQRWPTRFQACCGPLGSTPVAEVVIPWRIVVNDTDQGKPLLSFYLLLFPLFSGPMEERTRLLASRVGYEGHVTQLYNKIGELNGGKFDNYTTASLNTAVKQLTRKVEKVTQIDDEQLLKMYEWARVSCARSGRVTWRYYG